MLAPVVAAAHAAEFRRCLVDLDVNGIIKLWEHVAPEQSHCSSEIVCRAGTIPLFK